MSDLPPYVLTTPVRDERDGLPEVVAAMAAQTHRPTLWLLVDDGSTDGSLEWLEEQSAVHAWLEVVPAPEPATEYLGAHVARIKRWGLEQAIQRAVAGGTDPLHAGVVDADIVVPPDHYARLVEALESADGMGIVSSIVVSRTPDGGLLRERYQREDLPRGGTQFFKVACLDSIGGLPPFPGFDGAANVKARLRGWRCRLVTDLEAVQLRETATRFGAAAGYARKGRYAWFLGHHPLLIAARTVVYSAKAPRSAGLHFARAWLQEAVSGGARCPDPEIRAYYGRDRLIEYARSAVGRGPRFAD